jgi:transcriptional regulator with XRE-family HTH domain
MSLAQRVRDFRYSKGWGPDELASRAAISRTALYQIESGKTELPRAGTLRRIAMALDVSMETLLGHTEAAEAQAQVRPPRAAATGAPPGWARGTAEWFPNEGAALSAPSPRLSPRFDTQEGPRFAAEYAGSTPAAFESGLSIRERDIVSKFQELLATPYGDAVARIVEETYRLLPGAPVSAAQAAVSARSL